jgi:hypothetical protein
MNSTSGWGRSSTRNGPSLYKSVPDPELTALVPQALEEIATKTTPTIRTTTPPRGRSPGHRRLLPDPNMATETRHQPCQAETWGQVRDTIDPEKDRSSPADAETDALQQHVRIRDRRIRLVTRRAA